MNPVYVEYVSTVIKKLKSLNLKITVANIQKFAKARYIGGWDLTDVEVAQIAKKELTKEVYKQLSLF
jgi:hypothetical protein